MCGDIIIIIIDHFPSQLISQLSYYHHHQAIAPIIIVLIGSSLFGFFWSVRSLCLRLGDIALFLLSTTDPRNAIRISSPPCQTSNDAHFSFWADHLDFSAHLVFIALFLNENWGCKSFDLWLAFTRCSISDEFILSIFRSATSVYWSLDVWQFLLFISRFLFGNIKITRFLTSVIVNRPMHEKPRRKFYSTDTLTRFPCAMSLSDVFVRYPCAIPLCNVLMRCLFAMPWYNTLVQYPLREAVLQWPFAEALCCGLLRRP